MPKLKLQWTINWERADEEEYLKYIKARIKEAREDANMTQGELGKKIGRTQAYFSKLESGGLVPSIIETLGIAQFTQKPIQFFLPIQDTDDESLSGKEWQLVAHFRQFDDDTVRDMAIGAVKALAKTKTKAKK
jgi:transcriptional regulator with XRE-family HTH domain